RDDPPQADGSRRGQSDRLPAGRHRDGEGGDRAQRVGTEPPGQRSRLGDAARPAIRRAARNRGKRARRNKMRRSAGAAASIAVAVCAMISLDSCRREEPAALPEERVPVTTLVVKEESVPRVISCFGTITFTRKVDLSATVDGTVAQLLAKEGQTVKE